MLWLSRGSAMLGVVSLMFVAVSTGEQTTDQKKTNDMSAKSIYDFAVKDIDGKDVALSTYKGDVLLIVNVASK